MYRIRVVWLEVDALYAFKGRGFGKAVEMNEGVSNRARSILFCLTWGRLLFAASTFLFVSTLKTTNMYNTNFSYTQIGSTGIR